VQRGSGKEEHRPAEGKKEEVVLYLGPNGPGPKEKSFKEGKKRKGRVTRSGETQSDKATARRGIGLSGESVADRFSSKGHCRFGLGGVAAYRKGEKNRGGSFQGVGITGAMFGHEERVNSGKKEGGSKPREGENVRLWSAWRQETERYGGYAAAVFKREEASVAHRRGEKEKKRGEKAGGPRTAASILGKSLELQG